jgi:hypothetical protein
MTARRVNVARKSARARSPWLWDSAGYFLAIAVVGVELVTRLTFVH